MRFYVNNGDKMIFLALSLNYVLSIDWSLYNVKRIGYMHISRFKGFLIYEMILNWAKPMIDT